MGLDEQLAEIRSILESQRQFRESVEQSAAARMQAVSQAGSVEDYMRSLLRSKTQEKLKEIIAAEPKAENTVTSEPTSIEAPSAPTVEEMSVPEPNAEPAQVLCLTCGAHAPATAKFCPKCGQSMQAQPQAAPAALHCTNCGGETTPGARFCRNCGKAVASAPAAPVVPKCPGCGREVKPTAKFCGGCGRQLM